MKYPLSKKKVKAKNYYINSLISITNNMSKMTILNNMRMVNNKNKILMVKWKERNKSKMKQIQTTMLIQDKFNSLMSN
jgi:hypothetical protein